MLSDASPLTECNTNEDGRDKVSHSRSGFKVRGLTPHPIRTNDDVHITIPIPPAMREILDTPHLQRLRSLHQLGTSEIAYINATHCRFEHSLGVAKLAGDIVRVLRNNQPGLGIDEKDVLCVELAGLLHDVGHGPFSHIYDGGFMRLLGRAVGGGGWLGVGFGGEGGYGELPPVVEGWKHEDGSIMMVHALLGYHGLEIDAGRLDQPLRQIGDGIRAECFGVCGWVTERDGSRRYYDGDTPLPPHLVLTSRDWIFVLECIIGGPLPPKGQSIDTAHRSGRKLEMIGRPLPHKEFLFDVVSNRHSGLDVDKMDYLARDGRRAFGSAGKYDTMLIELAAVAWGDCPRPMQCFQCKHLDRGAKFSGDRLEGKHLMIVYPEKMVQNAMNFFKLRFRNHQYCYSHHTTNAAGYMICDILLLADPFYPGLQTFTEEEAEREEKELKSKRKRPLRLPISRAMQNPESYLRLKNSILDVIAATDSKELRPARKLIRRYQSRQLYKRVAEQSISSSNGTKIDKPWQRYLWELPIDDITNDIVKCGKLQNNDGGNGRMMELIADDIIVEKRQIHHGMGSDNPVGCMRFLHKSQMSRLHAADVVDLPIAEGKREEEYECAIPRAFLQRTLRIFCRDYREEKCEFLKTCYYQFIENVKKRSGSFGVDDGYDCIDNDDIENRPCVLTQSPLLETKRYKNSVNVSNSPAPNGVKRQRLFSSLDTEFDSP